MQDQSAQSNWQAALHWGGPFRIGGFGSSFDRSKVDQPHVYVCLMRYPSMTAAYVGRCGSLRTRIRAHLQYVLSLRYWLRNEQGEWLHKWRPQPDDWEETFDALDEVYPLAVAEAKRLEFYAAPCPPEYLKSVEGRLIRLLKSRSKADLVCDNQRVERDDDRLTVAHYTESEETGRLIHRLFGEVSERA